MNYDPMRQHRRTEGLAWGIALLGVLASIPALMVKAVVGFGILVVALVIACVVYYG
jgi:hypothetical protein